MNLDRLQAINAAMLAMLGESSPFEDQWGTKPTGLVWAEEARDAMQKAEEHLRSAVSRSEPQPAMRRKLQSALKIVSAVKKEANDSIARIYDNRRKG